MPTPTYTTLPTSTIIPDEIVNQLVQLNDRVGAIFLIFGLVIAGLVSWLIFKYLILYWFKSNFRLWGGNFMEPTAVPLITANDLAMVTTFGNQLKASIPTILLVIIPLALAIWILPTAVKKGISMMKGAFKKI